MAVTGYGEGLVKSAFSYDTRLAGTVAHHSAAHHFNPGVDFIINVGGQGMKCFRVRNGMVNSTMLNEACSSDRGSSIETFVKALSYTIVDLARLDLLARHPVNLDSRCIVFMSFSVKQAQKDRVSVEDIFAGLSVSVVESAVYKVTQAASADDLSQHTVV